MKRFTFTMLSLTALFILFFTSCEINETHEDFYLNTQTINYSVKKDGWNIGRDDESGDYLYCTFREPYLTRAVLENGMAIAYLRFSDGRLSPLPFSDFWVDQYGYRWEEQVTCDIEEGRITFIFKADDHQSEPYYNYDFVLKLMW
ncbi:MAG: hypothetical protein LBC48_03435 [Dysgonamonadaceae bacterium]|jgi:hypothetical protein|nr:hypothetical protein [Dysgonamonadaceae bacterium]